ncbi:MAG: restriction endonuclease subunit S [Nitrospirae bacterium]|nr:restriction endonuclease subunit S [Nitrospirota bacterium]
MSDREQLGGPQGWKRTTLGDALPIHYGKARNDRHGTVRVNTPVYGSSGRIDTFNRALTSGPSLIIGRKGNVGAAYYSPEPCWPIDTVYFTEASEEEDLRFFKYLLDHLQLVRKDRSTAVPGLSRDDYNATEVLVPELDQQRLVVAEIEKQFSRLDEAVANLKRVKANLKRYKAAVLKAAVEGKLTEDWRRQHPDVEPASKLLERILAERRKKWNGRGKYKEPTAPNTSDLPELPDLWGWATMPQLGELNRGKSKHRPRNDLKLFGGPYPFIQTGDVRRSGGFVRSHSQTYNESGLAQSRLWPAGTLCITIAANIAETGILTYSACFPDSVVGFVFDSVPVTVRFIDLFFRTEREEIARFAPATAQKNINLEILSAVAIPIPPFEEQNEIVAEVERRLSVIEALEAAVQANLTRSDRLRQSVLRVAFFGKMTLESNRAVEKERHSRT